MWIVSWNSWTVYKLFLTVYGQYFFNNKIMWILFTCGEKKKKKKLKTENVSVEFKRLLYLFLLPWGEIRWIIPQQDRPLRKVCSRIVVGRPCTSNRITRWSSNFHFLRKTKHHMSNFAKVGHWHHSQQPEMNCQW